MFEELIIAGYGGQGIMFCGTLLAHSAMEEGLNVTFFPSYGAEMRGGTANCRVVIATEEIGSPIVKNPSSLIIFNKDSLIRFAGQLKEKGLLIVNSSLVKEEIVEEKVEVIKVPVNQLAQKLGNNKVANMVGLGVYIKRKGIVSLESTIRALQNILLKTEKKNLIEINKEALKAGFQYQATL
ncbi:2-oxoacid:acceptor oxidoreductase family protein [bacterium]|nr:2-oxoacid:acceptor oxidoreductase family protein [bacterium]